MRSLLALLLIAACTTTLTGAPDHIATELAQEHHVPEPPPPKPEPRKKAEKPITVIITPPAKPVCVPLAVNEKKRIIQALDCLLEEPAKQ